MDASSCTSTNFRCDIFHIIVDLDVGGAELMLFRLLSGDTHTSKPVVVSLTSLGIVGQSLRDCGVTVHVLELSSIFQLWSVLGKLVQLIRQYQPRIVQTWMYHADLVGGLAARMAGIENVVWGIRRTAVIGLDRPATYMVVRICALLSYLIPKVIICVADSARISHISAGFYRRPFVVIPNGFDCSNYIVSASDRMAFRRSYHFSEGDVVIGNVGRFHADKGQRLFLTAAAMVARAKPAAKFLMVGRNCDESNTQLMGWLNEFGLQDKFTLLGERKDISLCLSAMDVFCMSSNTEGFPNGLAEAMASGLCCVGTDVGDARLLADDTVILSRAGSANALANNLVYVIGLTKVQRSQMGERARQRVSTKFTIGLARQRFMTVYQSISKGIL